MSLKSAWEGCKSIAEDLKKVHSMVPQDQDMSKWSDSFEDEEWKLADEWPSEEVMDLVRKKVKEEHSVVGELRNISNIIDELNLR